MSHVPPHMNPLDNIFLSNIWWSHEGHPPSSTQTHHPSFFYVLSLCQSDILMSVDLLPSCLSSQFILLQDFSCFFLQPFILFPSHEFFCLPHAFLPRSAYSLQENASLFDIKVPPGIHPINNSLCLFFSFMGQLSFNIFY